MGIALMNIDKRNACELQHAKYDFSSSLKAAVTATTTSSSKEKRTVVSYISVVPLLQLTLCPRKVLLFVYSVSSFCFV
jgi:hypothetical protein